MLGLCERYFFSCFTALMRQGIDPLLLTVIERNQKKKSNTNHLQSCFFVFFSFFDLYN